MTSPIDTRPPHVVVIGGGFCGAFFAAQLAHHGNAPVKISVIEPKDALGAGVAYSTPDPAHRVNVPAARMILFPENPNDFDNWMRRSGELDADPEAICSDGHIYPRRAAFGRYVANILADRVSARTDVSIEHIRDLASSVSRIPGGYEVKLTIGKPLNADFVVLATSHPPPCLPATIASQLNGDPGLISNPWQIEAFSNVPKEARVLIIGTGLTMADVVASLKRRGHTGHITAYSRRGLLPRGHMKASTGAPFNWFANHELNGNVLSLLTQIRTLVARAGEDDVPWQAVFDDIRINGQRLWRNFDETERRRFLRHLRVFWDAHRYRIAPQVEDVLKKKQQDGSLFVLAASLRSIGRGKDGIEIILHPRHGPAGHVQRFTVDYVVITTGPNHGTVVTQNPVLLSLAQQGLLKADSLGLGVAVDALGQAIKKDGTSEPTLLLVGPLAREQYGELMGMPQVSAQPNAVAEHVAEMLATRTRPAAGWLRS